MQYVFRHVCQCVGSLDIAFGRPSERVVACTELTVKWTCSTQILSQLLLDLSNLIRDGRLEGHRLVGSILQEDAPS